MGVIIHNTTQHRWFELAQVFHIVGNALDSQMQSPNDESTKEPWVAHQLLGDVESPVGLGLDFALSIFALVSYHVPPEAIAQHVACLRHLGLFLASPAR